MEVGVCLGKAASGYREAGRTTASRWVRCTLRSSDEVTYLARRVGHMLQNIERLRAELLQDTPTHDTRLNLQFHADVLDDLADLLGRDVELEEGL